MCSDAVYIGKKLAMVLFVKQHHQVAHPRTLSRYSEANYCCYEARWKSYFRVRELGESTDLGSDAHFVVFVRLRTT